MVICHALTGSADVEDWWGPLLGPSRAFDPSRYFIFCANVIGSPYGTISPVTTNPETGKKWGPELLGSCVKDDVRLHKLVLDSLGVKSVAVVIGGSMGGMTTLEYALNTPPGYVKHIIPIATSARHSAWGISWGEAQRQSIYSDPAYEDGYYCYTSEEEEEEEGDHSSEAVSRPRRRQAEEKQPARGLAAARMAALLTYRSRDSFESRFGRKSGMGSARRGRGGALASSSGSTRSPSPLESRPPTPREEARKAHNDGHRARQSPAEPLNSLPTVIDAVPLTNIELSMPGARRGVPDKIGAGIPVAPKQPGVFSAQSYLRYQGDKFTARFDANCYIHITRKMDTHDISYPSSHPGTLSYDLPEPPAHPTEAEETDALAHALSLLPPALVIGIESDGLFTTREQREIASSIKDSELVIIPSPDGHDGFLLEFEALNKWVLEWLHKKLPEVYQGDALIEEAEVLTGFGVQKESVFGEAEADVTRW